MRIWAYHPSLKPAIDALHDFGVNPMRDLYHRQHGPDSYGQYWRRTLVAEDGGQVIGVATAAATIVWPHRTLGIVEVSPDHRRRGVGRALFEAISTLRGRPLDSMVWPAEPAGVRFAESLGARVLAECPLPTVDPTSPEIAAWVNEHAPGDLRFENLEGKSRRAIRRTFVDICLWTEKDWLPMTRDQAAHAFRADPGRLVPPHSVFAYNGRRLAAAAFVFIEPDVCRIGAETFRRDEPDGHRILAATVAEALRRLGAAGVNKLIVDGHTHEPHIAPILSSLPAVSASYGRHVQVPAPTSARPKTWGKWLRPGEHRERLVLRT